MAKTKVKKDGGLSQRALLVSVNISQWAGRRIDKRATETANLSHKASSTAGNYHKKLLPNAVELKEVSAIASKAREYFYTQTLPWMADGSRIISSKNYLPFVAEMRKIKADFDSAVKGFEAAYPRLKAEAVKQLGDLYDADEYPEDIASKFKIETNYLPMPDVEDFRTEISDTEKREFLSKMREVEGAAMRDCWDRLHKVVKTAATKLAEPDAIFRDSLVENISEIVNLLPKLNITEDANLEKSRLEIEKLVAGLSPETLRVNSKERDKASKKLAEIESKMGAFMGVPKNESAKNKK